MKTSRKGVRILSLVLGAMLLLTLAAPAMAANIVSYGALGADATVYSTSGKAAVLGSFKSGDIVGIETQTTSMYKVRLSANDVSTGYIDKTAVSKTTTRLPAGSAMASMQSGSGSAAGGTGVIYNVKVDVTFRKTASKSGTKLGTLKLGKEVSVLGLEKDFYKVVADGVTGYVHKDYVKLNSGSAGSGTTTASGTAMVASSTKLFTSADSKSKSLGSLSKGAVVTIKGESGEYYQVTSGTKTGYVLKTKLTVLPDTTSLSGTGLVSKSTKLYKAQHASSGSAASLSKGATITITGESGTFYEAKSGTKTGYVLKSVVTLMAETTPLSGTGTTNKNSVKMYKAASTTAGVATTISKSGSTVTLLGENGNFYEVKYGTKTGFVEKTLITVSGGATGGTATTGGTDTGKVTTVNDVSAIKVTPGSGKLSSTASSGLSAAQKKNSDTIGYINLAGTNIQQPILHRKNNYTYYSSRDINGKSSSAGSVHTVYASMMRNNTITAHNMRGSNNMFHQLHHIQEKALGYSTCQTTDYKCKASSLSGIKDIKTTSNRVWEISLFGYTQWEVWAMYETPANEPKSTINYNIHPLSDKASKPADIAKWVNYQKGRSEIKFNTAVSTSDIFLTIYTCGTNYDYSSAQSRLYFFLKAVK